MFKKFILSSLLAFSFTSILNAEATFSRIKDWENGELLDASDLDAEFDNIINNLDPSGIGDYSSSVSQMRSTSDPYPASVESLPTSLAGELERIRYQILYLLKAFKATGSTYWYEDPPTQGAITIDSGNKYVGFNDTSPDAYISIDNSGDNAPAAIALHGGTGNRYWIVGSTITNALLIGQGASASTIPDASNYAIKINSDNSVTFGNGSVGGTRVFASTADWTNAGSGVFVISMGSEQIDELNEFNGSTFTAANTGIYSVIGSADISGPSTSKPLLRIYKNGSVITGSDGLAVSVGATYLSVSDAGAGEGAMRVTVPLLLNLTAGDTITLRGDGASGTYHYRRASLTIIRN